MPSDSHTYDVAVVGGGAAGTAAAVGMGTALATGHAAGVAAAQHAAAGKPVPARQVQQELQRQDARLAGI